MATSPTRAGPGAPEYVDDVPYPRQYVPQIAPPLLRLVAAMNGRPAPPEDDFDYCELGSAMGDTLALFAAANPGGRFVGIELNPEHVAFSRRLAVRGQLENLTVLQQDFEQLPREELPDFDFIVAHGFLTWVSAAKREAVYAFARAKLKPGGLLYVSYDALPGWSAVEPLRRLMLDYTARMGGPVIDRAREGVAYAQRLADSGAAYFANNPTAKSMLALMKTAGLPYVVHEYFNAHWQPLYFADLSRSMAAHDLAFVGQLPLHLNVPELATPPTAKKIAEGTRDRIAFETFKDFANNELFRSDVFAKGKAQPSESEMRFYFESTPFGTMAPLAQLKRDARLPHYTVDFKGPVYDAILGAIADAPATAMELGLRPALGHLGQLRIGDCLRNLILGGQVVPMRIEPPNPMPGSRHRLRLPHNEVALEEALGGEGPLVLASPVTGAGVRLSLLELIALRLLVSVEPAAHAQWLRDFAERRSMPLDVGDRKLKTVDELLKVIPTQLERLRQGLPKLVALGILEEAP